MPKSLPALQNIEDLPIPERLIDDVVGRNGRAVVIFAIGMGFTGIAGKEHSLMAPDGTRVGLPMHGDLNFKVFRSKINTIVTHAEPVVSPFSLVEIIALHLKLDPDHLRVLRVAIDKFQKRVSSVVHPPLPSAGEEGEDVPVVIPPLTRDLIKEEPWTAHGRSRPNQQGTETYPSDAVMERLWSDDTTDYACRWPDCDYVRTNPRSVAAHFTSHVRGQGKAPQPEGDGVDTEWTPKQITRIRRLKRELDGALTAALAAGIDFQNTQWVAEWIINHRIEDLAERGDTGESDDGPLTAEQILDKIAALADRGRAHSLREQIVILNDLLDQSEKARARVEGNLHALRDMINEADA
jgi:hypothetical protein